MKLTDQEFEAQYQLLLAEVARFYVVLAAGYKMLAEGKCDDQVISAVRKTEAAITEAKEMAVIIKESCFDPKRKRMRSVLAHCKSQACSEAMYFYEAAQLSKGAN